MVKASRVSVRKKTLIFDVSALTGLDRRNRLPVGQLPSGETEQRFIAIENRCITQT